MIKCKNGSVPEWQGASVLIWLHGVRTPGTSYLPRLCGRASFPLAWADFPCVRALSWVSTSLTGVKKKNVIKHDDIMAWSPAQSGAINLSFGYGLNLMVFLFFLGKISNYMLFYFSKDVKLGSWIRSVNFVQIMIPKAEIWKTCAMMH